MTKHRLNKDLADGGGVKDDGDCITFEIFGPVKNPSTELFKSHRSGGKNCLMNGAVETVAGAVNSPPAKFR